MWPKVALKAVHGMSIGKRSAVNAKAVARAATAEAVRLIESEAKAELFRKVRALVAEAEAVMPLTQTLIRVATT